MSEHTLTGKVALVTGAGSGLGEATARALAAAGCRVACVDINEQASARVANEIAQQELAGTTATTALPFQCDVSDAAAVATTVAAVNGRMGRLDIMVNCAAVDYTYSVEEMSIEQWDRAVAINLRGPFLFAKSAFPIMREQGGGHIVNIGSTAGLRAWANTSVYHATKWGLMGLSRGLGVEGRSAGIRVTTIIPGGMRTHFFDRFKEQGIPMPDPAKLQDPATVANAIVFALQVPPESSVQELLITPLDETSWP
ncbi:MAG: SDR family oxidoreductase [Chloroflexota bacterium]|nr:SDR family oxidoreductase [Chloroflexota bacterium]